MQLASAPQIAETTAAALQRAEGEGRITTKVRDGKTRVAALFQEGAAKIRLPHTYDGSLQAVLMNTAGGLTGGDRMRWQAEAVSGAHLVLTTPACERIYRSLGADAVVETRLAAGAGARLDWLPQETILFDSARLHRRLDVDLADDATFLAIEAVLIGREAMGEAARAARLIDNWRIRRGGRLIHADATRLAADDLERQSLSLLAGSLAFATIVYVGSDATHRLAAMRAVPDQPGLGSSAIGERLIIRAMAPSGLALRRMIVPIVTMLSAAGSLPRLWNL